MLFDMNMYPFEVEGCSRYRLLWLLAASGTVASTALGSVGLADASIP